MTIYKVTRRIKFENYVDQEYIVSASSLFEAIEIVNKGSSEVFIHEHNCTCDNNDTWDINKYLKNTEIRQVLDLGESESEAELRYIAGKDE